MTIRSIAASLAALCVAAAAGAQEAPPPPVRPPPPAPTGEAAPPPDTIKPSAEVTSKEAFVTRLTPYGKWVETPEYGRVFVPNVQAQSADWRPYVSGRW